MRETMETIDKLVELFKDLNDEDKIGWVAYFLENLEELFGEQLLRQIMAMLETRFKYGAF